MASSVPSVAGLMVCMALGLVMQGCGNPAAQIQKQDLQIQKQEAAIQKQEETIQRLKDTIRAHDAAAKDVEGKLRTSDTDLRGKVKAAQEQDSRDVKAADAQLETTEKDLRGKIEDAREQDQHDVKAEDAEVESEEQTNKHLQDVIKKDDKAKKEDAKLQSGLAAARAQLQEEKANDAALLRRAEDKFDESQSIIFGAAAAVAIVLIVAAVAFCVAFKKQKALGEALKELASSKAQHGQLDEPLLQSDKKLGKDGVKDVKQSHVTVV